MRVIAGKVLPISTLHKPLDVVSKIFWVGAEGDRFGLLNHHSSFCLTNDKSAPLPSWVKSNLSIQELCIDRAKEMLKQNKKILILWSGGVDSTCMIASFILAGAKEELLIVCTDEIEGEASEEYKWLIAEGYNVEKFTAWSNYKDCLITAGWCADQLFGSILNQRYSDLHNIQWQDGLNHIIKRQNHETRYTVADIRNALDVLGEYFRNLKLDINYTDEALWAVNFCIKYSHIRKDLHLTVPSELRENIMIFFDTTEFQDWSLNNYKTFHEHPQINTNTYKLPLKELVYKVFKNEDYLVNKGKKGSWGATKNPNISIFNKTTLLLESGEYKEIPWSEISFFDLPFRLRMRENIQETIQDYKLKLVALEYLKDDVDKEAYLRGIKL